MPPGDGYLFVMIIVGWEVGGWVGVVVGSNEGPFPLGFNSFLLVATRRLTARRALVSAATASHNNKHTTSRGHSVI